MADKLDSFKRFFKKGTHWLGRRTIESLIRHNYETAKAYHHYKLRSLDNQSSELPVLIYQMGKVGSTTMELSLGQTNINRRIYHVHYLTPEWSKKYDLKYKQEYKQLASSKVKWFWTAQHVARLVEQPLRDGEKWQIITLVRDPVARNISSFFHHVVMENLEGENAYRLRSNEYDFEITVTDDDLDQLMSIFFERSRHDSPLTFFDRELKGVFDVDVFSSSFPIEQGYKIYETDQAHVLLIRLENLNACASQALKDFLDVEMVELEEANLAVKKSYADAYQQFKHSVVIPDAYLDKMYNSKYSRHFYSQAEIAQFRETWSR